MKKMRIPLFVVLGVGVLGIILGSFLDFQISSAIANAHSVPGILFSALGETIAFLAVALMGGGFIAYGLKKDYHIVLRILFFVLSLACLITALLYTKGAWFGVNGFSWVGVDENVGIAIVIVPILASMVGGYFLFRNATNRNMWIIWCAVIVMLVIGLLGIISPLKGVLHRPRYRVIAAYEEVTFHNWWQPCKNYMELREVYGLESDHFKSYPSGHSGEISILIVAATFFPLADKKFEKYQMPAFYIACGCAAITMFARILAAAHFLSDVSWGMSIIVFLTFVTNEILMRVKAVQPKE